MTGNLNLDLQRSFEAGVERHIAEAQDLIRSAYKKHGEGLIMLTSAGSQSAGLFQLVRESGLKLPVAIVDIKGAEFDEQRSYFRLLTGHYDTPVHIFPAATEEAKKVAMNEGLARIGATALLDGIHRDQTAHRAKLSFREVSPAGGPENIHPVLNWTKDIMRHYIATHVDEWLQHPAFKNGQETKGGRVGPALHLECPLRFGGQAIGAPHPNSLIA